MSSTAPEEAESSNRGRSFVTKLVACDEMVSAQLTVPPTSTALPASQMEDEEPVQRIWLTPVTSRSMVVLRVSYTSEAATRGGATNEKSLEIGPPS